MQFKFICHQIHGDGEPELQPTADVPRRRRQSPPRQPRRRDGRHEHIHGMT